MPGFVQELPRPPNPCIGGGFFLPPISAGKIDGQKKKGAKRKHLIVLLSRRQPSQKKSTTPLLSFRALILFLSRGASCASFLHFWVSIP